MRFIYVTVAIYFFTVAGKAQQANYTAFTVNDGLPSNYVYRCIEDNNGFLWVATDAGIARFDGKHFQVFTTQHGLPDNEVLAIVKENNGRIWANCFKQSPAYFDEVQNRFINAREDTNLAKIKEGTFDMYTFPLKSGGVMFVNEKGSFVFKNKKLTSYYSKGENNEFLIKENEDGTHLNYGVTFLNKKLSQHKLYQLRGSTYLDSVFLRNTKKQKLLVRPGLSDDKLYIFNETAGKCFIYDIFHTNPIRFSVDSITIPELCNNFEFVNDYLYLLGMSGKIYLFNKKKLGPAVVISGNYLANSIYSDSKGNMWVSTIDKGLLLYKKQQLGRLEMPESFTNTNFLSIARKKDGTLLAGNFYGEVIAAKAKKITINYITKKALINRQRKFLFLKTKFLPFLKLVFT